MKVARTTPRPGTSSEIAERLLAQAWAGCHGRRFVVELGHSLDDDDPNRGARAEALVRERQHGGGLDDLAAARGIAFGLFVSALLWAGIVALCCYWFRR
jgi:hypothetical protein